MSQTFTVRLPADDDEVQALLDNHRPIFHVPPERMQEYATVVGRENFRLIYDGDDLAGGLWIAPMGQFFGGRSVPTGGVAAVGVAPHMRGRGAATALMRETICSLHAQGCPLSTLFPATQPVYRCAGYEQAGCLFEITLPLNTVRVRDRALSVRPIKDGDLDSIKQAYIESVGHTTGPLDRGDYIWRRVFKPRTGEADGFLVERDGSVEGYVYIARQEGGRIHYNLRASDLVALTPQAGRRLLSFLADHRSLADQLVCFRPPWDPVFGLLDEQCFDVRLEMQWMLRLVDVPKALEMRGYPAGLSTELHFNVRDDLVEANNDRFVLHVRDGRGKATRGGQGRLDIDVCGLASLYSGYRTPHQLITADLLAPGAAQADLDAATAAFVGPAPWMADQF